MTEQVATVLDAEEVLRKQVNGAGQVYIGRDLSGKTVRVAYEIVDDEPATDD